MYQQANRCTLAALVGLTLSLGGAPRVAAAQRLDPGYLHGTLMVIPTTPPSPVGRAAQPNDATMILGGLVGGTVGFFGGGYLGALIGSSSNCGEWCGFEVAFWGAAAGVSTLLPLGVHVTNGSRGEYGRSLVVSLAIGAAGVGLAYATNNGIPLLFIPVGQLITSVLIEHRTGTRSP